MDALAAYFQIDVRKLDQPKATFMLHSGRYFFRKTIMGNQLSRETWLKASNEVTKNLDGVFKLVDNLLIGGWDCAQLAERLEAFLARCQKAGMTHASNKVQLGSKVREAIKKRLFWAMYTVHFALYTVHSTRYIGNNSRPVVLMRLFHCLSPLTKSF